MSESSENSKGSKRIIDLSKQTANEFYALDEAAKSTVQVTEKDFPERRFPMKFNPKTYKYDWEEGEIRNFYEDPENIPRTIFCREINVDETDGWGMFGYTPGYIYVEKKRYEGSKTYADEAASFGLSMGFDPKTGLGVMNHFDYFPRYKFEYQLIKKSDQPEIYSIMKDIFNKKGFAENSVNKPQLGTGE